MKNRVFNLLLLLPLVFLLASCDFGTSGSDGDSSNSDSVSYSFDTPSNYDPDEPSIIDPEDGASLSRTYIELDVGDSYFLSSFYRDDVSPSDVTYNWSFSNADVIAAKNGKTLDEVNNGNEYAIDVLATAYGESTITLDLTYDGETTSLTCNVKVIEGASISLDIEYGSDREVDSVFDSLTENLTSSNISVSGSYSTGNYTDYIDEDYITYNNRRYEYYRAISQSGRMMRLLPYYDNENDGSAPGAFYNLDSFSYMTSLTINYYNAASSDYGMKLSLSYDGLTYDEVYLDNSTSTTSISVIFNGYRYFEIETTGTDLYLVSVEVGYLYNEIVEREYNNYVDDGMYRISAPTPQTSNLVNGETTVEMPIKTVLNDDGTVEVVETKTYTYYTTTYLRNNLDKKDEIALTDPVDVANYYLAFNTTPANYTSSTSDARTLGECFRRYSSWYSRTDGYVNALPIDTSNLDNSFQYIELDIEIGENNYVVGTSVTRGVGRLIIFSSFNELKDTYGNDMVVIYTDDHYATFKEYYNNGEFGTRFNAQTKRTPYDYLYVDTYPVSD